jgi:hypothetical protein
MAAVAAVSATQALTEPAALVLKVQSSSPMQFLCLVTFL